RAHVDRAGRRVGVGLGARRAADLDGFYAGDQDALEARGARGVAAAAVRVGAGAPHAVDRDADILAVHAAEPRAARLGLDVVDVDAGEVFQELAHVAIGDVAEDVGRD